jgi:hypothetical protein
MVCYAGRVADNPIVVRECASNPSGPQQGALIVRYETQAAPQSNER